MSPDDFFAIEVEVAGEPTRVMTHQGPHFEDLLAVFIAQEYGTTEFLNEYTAGGDLYVGCGEGPLDEHAHYDRDRHMEKKCAALLVAEALGVEKDSSLRQLLKFALFTDRGKPQHDKYVDVVEHYHPLTPDQRIKEQWREFAESPEAYDCDPMVIIDRAMDEIRLFHRKQVRFFAACDAVKKSAVQFDVPYEDDSVLCAVVVRDDNPFINAAARSRLKADIVVQRKSDGHVQIHTREREPEIPMWDVHRALNVFEQEAEGNVRVTDWRVLGKDGKIDDDGKWFLTRHGQILNGSESYPDVVVTLLTDEQIRRAIEIALNQNAFDEGRAGDCVLGKCTSTRKSQCPLFKFGFSRCQKCRCSGSRSRRREACPA